jgi:hypothetical protein
MPEDREPGAKEPKRFTVNFFSTDGTYKNGKLWTEPRLSWRDRVARRRCP